MNDDRQQRHDNQASQSISRESSTEIETAPHQQHLDPHILKLLDFTRRGKNDLLSNLLDVHPEAVNTNLPDGEDSSFLHIASSNNQSSTVELLLTKYHANPCVKNMRNLKPYDVATDKETRNAFRRVMHQFPDLWDWKDAHVPSPLSPQVYFDRGA